MSILIKDNIDTYSKAVLLNIEKVFRKKTAMAFSFQ